MTESNGQEIGFFSSKNQYLDNMTMLEESGRRANSMIKILMMIKYLNYYHHSVLKSIQYKLSHQNLAGQSSDKSFTSAFSISLLLQYRSLNSIIKISRKSAVFTFDNMSCDVNTGWECWVYNENYFHHAIIKPCQIQDK